MITLVSSLRADYDHIQITDSTAVMTDTLRQQIVDMPQSARMDFHGVPDQVVLSVSGEELCWENPDGIPQRRKIVVAPAGYADLSSLPHEQRMAIVGSHVIAGKKISVAFDDEETANRQIRILFRMYPQIKVGKRLPDSGTGAYFVTFELVDQNRN